MTLEQQQPNSRLLWIIVGGISITVLLFLAIQWFFAEYQNKPKQTTAQLAELKAPPPNLEKKAEAITTVPAASEPEPRTLVDQSILKAPIPDNASLAKEEVAKLDDIQAQLKDQQSTLKSQHQDVETLIKLKEEQIKLLEAQLAEQK